MGSSDRVRAIILAGGFGTRLRSILTDAPKPMVLLAGRSVLFRQIDLLNSQGISDVTVLGGHLGHVLHEAILTEYGASVRVIVEDHPLGTGGALSLAPPSESELTLVISGDLLFNVDLAKLASFHRDHRATITLTAHSNSHPLDADLLELKPHSNQVAAIRVRPHPKNILYANVVNASIAVVDAEVWKHIEVGTKANFEKDVVTGVLNRSGRVLAYRTSEYIKDIGTPERLDRAAMDIQSGLVEARSLKFSQRAVFIEQSCLCNLTFKADVNLNCSALNIEENSKAIILLNSSKFLAFVVADRLSKHDSDSAENSIHNTQLSIETIYGNHGAKFDDLDLRNLETALKRLQRIYNLDLSRSYLITKNKLNSASSVPGLRALSMKDGIKTNTLIDSIKTALADQNNAE